MSRQILNFGLTVIGTGVLGWVLNIVLVLCSGPLYVSCRKYSMHLFMTMLPGRIFPDPLAQPSFRHVMTWFAHIARSSSCRQIMALRMGKSGALFLWVRRENTLCRICIPSSSHLFAS